MTRRMDSPEVRLTSEPAHRAISACGCILVGMLFLQVGCNSRQVYHANQLPPQLAATYVGSAQSLDLARISRAIGNSEVIYPGDVVREEASG